MCCLCKCMESVTTLPIWSHMIFPDFLTCRWNLWLLYVKHENLPIQKIPVLSFTILPNNYLQIVFCPVNPFTFYTITTGGRWLGIIMISTPVTYSHGVTIHPVLQHFASYYSSYISLLDHANNRTVREREWKHLVVWKEEFRSSSWWKPWKELIKIFAGFLPSPKVFKLSLRWRDKRRENAGESQSSLHAI